MASPEHARVWVADGQVWIVDLGSVGGTAVNGLPIAGPCPLQGGDHLRLADVEAVFYLAPGPDVGRRRQDSAATEGAYDPAKSATTRYLCAATHLDHRYRTRVLDATVREAHRAVCPSYGVDLAVVARHAVLAHRRALLRDAGLTAILTILVVGLIAAATSGRGAGGLAFWLVWLVAAWGVGAAETWVRLSTLGRYLRPGGLPDQVPPPVGPRAAHKLATLDAANAGNVIVYSGFLPFVGSGELIDAGGYPVPLLPLDTGMERGARAPRPFRAGELLADVAEALRSLRLQDLRVDRRVLVGGFDVARVPELLPNRRARPVAYAPDSFLDNIVECPSGAARPYLSARTTGWQGHLVVTTFVRVVVLAGMLFIETATLVLPPLRAEYLAVDAMRIRGAGERFGSMLGETTRNFVPDLLTAPMRLLAAAAAKHAANARNREFERRIADRIQVDYGTRTSIREQASREQFDGYFLTLDAEMAVSVVQQKVADTVASFLEIRGYATDKINLIQNNISTTTMTDNSVSIKNKNGHIAGVGFRARGDVSARGQSNKREGRGAE
jgi:hypothetical protein